MEVSDSDGGSFRLVAYDGGVTQHWYWGNFAIDLGGLSFAANKLPVLDSHWTDSRIGFTTRQEVGSAVTAEGRFLDNTKAQELRKDMLKGFPMQASLWGIPTKIEQVMEGATAQVNGRTVEGPGAIWRQAAIKEISMCVFGALQNTQSTAFGADDDIEVAFTLLGKENKMSKEDKPALTVDQFKADNQALYDQVFAAGRNEGIAAAYSVFGKLKEACGDDTALLATAFAEKWDAERIHKERAAKLAAENAKLREQIAKAPATVTAADKARQEFIAQPAPAAPADPTKAFDEASATDDDLKTHFAATKRLQDQFSCAEAYVEAIRHPPKE